MALKLIEWPCKDIRKKILTLEIIMNGIPLFNRNYEDPFNDNAITVSGINTALYYHFQSLGIANHEISVRCDTVKGFFSFTSSIDNKEFSVVVTYFKNKIHISKIRKLTKKILNEFMKIFDAGLYTDLQNCITIQEPIQYEVSSLIESLIRRYM